MTQATAVDTGITDLLADPRIQEAVADTLPLARGQRNRCVFSLARRLKALPELASADLRQLKPIIQEWHRQALANIETQAFEESWLDFVIAWERVAFAADQPPLEWALEQAKLSPVADADEYEQEQLRWLVGVCYHLAIKSRDGVFYLSTRSAGALLGVDHKKANRWLRLLCFDGVLKELAKGDASGRASRFRWTGAAPLAGEADAAGQA
jgi:hypothetical protein